MDSRYFLFLIIFGLLCFLVAKFIKVFKLPKVGAMCLISGGVKTGKTTFAVALAISKYRRAHFNWLISRWFAKLFNKPIPEEPLLYSNIPLTVPYCPLTKDILERKVRVRYKSVIYVCEASLLADSQMYRDMALNDRLLLFNKLIGHSTRGGIIIYDTQTIADCHNAVKKCLSEYFYIHHLVKWLPGFLIAYICEERYSYDGSVVSSYSTDVEERLTRVIIPKSTWKKFDCYCYSALTDNLPVECSVVKKAKSLKVDKIVSFKNWDRYITKNDKEKVIIDEKKDD